MIDPFSQTWKEIAALANAQLVQATAELEATGLDLAATEFQRGRIAVLKGILSMAVPKPVIEDIPTTY